MSLSLLDFSYKDKYSGLGLISPKNIPVYILNHLLSMEGHVYIFRDKIHLTFPGTFNLGLIKDSAEMLVYEIWFENRGLTM